MPRTSTVTILRPGVPRNRCWRATVAIAVPFLCFATACQTQGQKTHEHSAHDSNARIAADDSLNTGATDHANDPVTNAGDSIPKPPAADLTFHPESVDGYQHQTSNVGAYEIYYEFLDLDDSIPVNDPVGLNIVVVDQHGMLIPNDVSLNVDAAMPHHRHGVVRIPSVTRVDPGRFEVEGVLFHMPGRWELYFDVTDQGRTERTQVELVLE